VAAFDDTLFIYSTRFHCDGRIWKNFLFTIRPRAASECNCSDCVCLAGQSIVFFFLAQAALYTFFYQRRRLFYLGSGLYLFDDIREAGSFAGCVYGFSAFTNDDDEWRQKVLLDLRGLARHLRRLWVLKHGIGWMVSFLILRYGCLYMHRKNAGDVSGGGSFFSNAVTIPWIFYYTISSLSCILVWR